MLSTSLSELGYVSTVADECMFYKRVVGCATPVVLMVYVDDLVITYDKSVEHVWLADKLKLTSQYKIKDLGECSFILKMKIVRDRVNKITYLSQYGYVKSLIEQFDISKATDQVNPGMTIDLTAPDLSKHSERLSPKLQHLYQSITGSLLYLAVCSRIDIAYVASFLSRFNAAPTDKHLKYAKHVLQYLKGTAHYALVFKCDPEFNGTFNINAYSDSDFGGDHTTRSSTLGNIVCVNGSPVAWQSQRQKSIALSSTEAEYVGQNAAARECIWIKKMLMELLNVNTIPIMIYSDNQAAIVWTTGEKVDHNKAKHIDIRYKYVRNLYKDGVINMKWIGTKQMLADVLTKRLNNDQFINIRDQLIKPIKIE
jgi:hypothetical protein